MLRVWSRSCSTHACVSSGGVVKRARDKDVPGAHCPRGYGQ